MVDIAHAVGKKVAAHAHGAESIRMAIAAGVDTIEHASYLDDAGIAAALQARRRRAGHGRLQRRLHRHRRPEGQLARGIPAQEHRDHGNPAPGIHQGGGGRRSHRVRHRLRRVPARTQCAPVSHHGGARHDADAGASGRPRRWPRSYMGWASDVGTIEAGQVRRHHRREGRSAQGHHACCRTSRWW